MFSKSKWKENNFKSFWNHYELVQQWMKVINEAKQVASNNFEWHQTKNNFKLRFESSKKSICQKNFNKLLNNDNQNLIVADVIKSKKKYEKKEEKTEEVELLPEMIEFYQKTITHQIERDKKKLEAEKKTEQKSKEKFCEKSWLSDDEGEYVFANEVGIYGIQKQTVKSPTNKIDEIALKNEMNQMYGKSAPKIRAMELSLNFKFNEHYKKFQPALWPNIPIRFKNYII